MASWLVKLRSWLLGILLFVLPINIFLAFPTGEEYLSGLRIDYLIPKLYLADICVITLLILYFLTEVKLPKKPVVVTPYIAAIAAVLAALILAQSSVSLSLIAVLSFTKVLLGIVLMILTWKEKLKLKDSIFILPITFALIWQLFLSLYQWFSQKALLPYFLSGETRIDSTIFTAKSTILFPGHVLPYGSTAHPNILAGFAAIYGIALLGFWLQHRKDGHKTTYWSLFGVFIAAILLILTESISAILTFFGGSYFLLIQTKVWKKIHALSWYSLALILSILLTVGVLTASLQWPENPSLWRRAELLVASATMIVNHPIAGVGGSNFTPALSELQISNRLAPFIQPVHNTPVLFAAEYGLLGLALLLLIATTWRYGWFASELPIHLLAILPILNFDHYLLSQTPGIYTFALIPLLWQWTVKTRK